MEQNKTLIVAITGGIGCGQTTVADFFEKFGAKAVNADLISRQVVNNDAEVRRELKREFGKRVFYRNGRLNRKRLGQIVFDDQTKTHRLNKIIHPRMVDRVIEEIEAARDSGKYPMVVVDAALVYEVHLEQMFDAIVVVASRMGNRIKRIQERDKISEEEIRQRMYRQIPIEEKIKWADFVIHNNGNLQHLEEKSKKVYNRLMKRQRKKPSRRKKS